MMTRGQVGSRGQGAETAEVFDGPWTVAVAMAEACEGPWTGGAPERVKGGVCMTGKIRKAKYYPG